MYNGTKIHLRFENNIMFKKYWSNFSFRFRRKCHEGDDVSWFGFIYEYSNWTNLETTKSQI